MADVLAGTVRVALNVTDEGFQKGFSLAQATLTKFESSMSTFGRTVAATSAIITGGLITGAVAFTKGFSDMNAQLETSSRQFKVFLGSASEANDHVRQLFNFAKETPFETGPVIEASRQLEVMGGTALDTMKNLTMVGDAAAGVSRPISEVAFWFGRAYTNIQAGRPFGEAAMRLQEMGILSGTARNKIEALQKAGADSTTVWNELQKSFTRFNGSMKEQAQTWQGLTSTLKDAFNLGRADVTRPLFTAIENIMKQLVAFTNSPAWDQLIKKGAEVFQRIADKVNDFAQALGKVLANADFNKLIDRGHALYDAYEKVVPVIAALSATFVSFGANSLPLIGRFIPAINPVLALFSSLVLSTQEGRDAMEGFANSIGRDLKSASSQIMPLFVGMQRALADIAPSAEKFMEVFASQAIQTFVNAMKVAVAVFIQFLAVLKPVLDLLNEHESVIRVLATVISTILVSRAVYSAIDGFTKLGTSIKSATKNSAEAATSAGLLGVAVTGVVLAYTYWRQRGEENRKTISDMTSALSDQTKTVDENTQAWLANAVKDESNKGVNRLVQSGVTDFETLNQALQGNSEAYDKITGAVQRYGKAQFEAGNALGPTQAEQMQGDLEKLTEQYEKASAKAFELAVNTGEISKAAIQNAHVTLQQRGVHEDLAKLLQQSREEQTKLNSATATSVGTGQLFAAAYNDASRALNDVDQAASDTAETMEDKLKKALDELDQMFTGLVGGPMAEFEAALDFGDSVESFITLSKNSKTTKEELDHAAIGMVTDLQKIIEQAAKNGKSAEELQQMWTFGMAQITKVTGNTMDELGQELGGADFSGYGYTLGLNYGLGIGKGFKDAIPNVVADVSTGLYTIQGVAIDVIDAHSPSGVFAEHVGRPIALGIGEGIKDGTPDAAKEMEDLMKYLEAVARKRVDDLNAVFDSINAASGLRRAKKGVDEAKKSLDDLVAEKANLPALIAQAQNRMNNAVAGGAIVTAREQVAIDNAYKNYQDVVSRLGAGGGAGGAAGMNPSTPMQYFAQNSGGLSQTMSQQASTVYEAQVAWEDYQKAIADSTAPLDDFNDAQQDYNDLLKRQTEIDKDISDAQDAYADALEGLVEQQFRSNQAADRMKELGPDIVGWYKQIATQAGLTTGQIQAMNMAMDSTAMQGKLFDTWGNGSSWDPLDVAVAKRNWVLGQNGQPGITSDQFLATYNGVPKGGGGGQLKSVTVNVAGSVLTDQQLQDYIVSAVIKAQQQNPGIFG